MNASICSRSREDSFRNRTVLVVGASSGIGAETCRALSHAGAHLILVARDKPRLQTTASNLPDARILTADISSVDQCALLANSISKIFESLDHLVVSSGFFASATIENVDQSTWDTTIATNLTGPFFLIQKLLPLLLNGHGRSIVLLSSVLAHVGASATAAYSASKGGLSSLVRSLAVELAPRRIRVNVVSPGHVDTPMIVDLTSDSHKLATILRQYPLGRIGTPKDIAALVLYLLGDQASWITGHDFIIDGGRSIADT